MIYEIQQTRGAALAPLSSEQRQKLAAIGSYAWKEIGPDQSYDDWRHDQVMKLVGKAGLRECSNEDYLPIKAAWLEICGLTKAAWRAAIKSANEPREWALFSLLKACTEAADVLPRAMDYARGFVKNKRHVALEDADDKTIWNAVYTVRRKAQALRHKLRGTKPRRHQKGPF